MAIRPDFVAEGGLVGAVNADSEFFIAK